MVPAGTYTAFSTVTKQLLHIKDVVFTSGEVPRIFIYGRLFRQFDFKLETKTEVQKLLREVSTWNTVRKN